MTELIISSGVTSSGLVVSAGETLAIRSGGVALDTTVQQGGTMTPAPGGLANNLTVDSGAWLVGAGDVEGTVEVDGTVNGVTLVNSSGSQDASELYILAGGKSLNVTLAAASPPDATEVVSLGGTATGGTIHNGVLVVMRGATATRDVVFSGGEESVFGGSVSGETISSGGTMPITSSGRASGTILHSGGIETIGVQGSAVGTVLSGGYEFDYGPGSGTRVLSGGHLIVEGGDAVGSVISSGGGEVVSRGGSATSPTVSAGGTLVVTSNGWLSSGLIVHGGTAIIDGPTTPQTQPIVSFAGGSGVLELGDLSVFDAAISGLEAPNEKVDLVGFAYSTTGETVSWSQSGASGTLTVNDGSDIANLTLIGAYVTSDFDVFADGNGGTDIKDSGTSPATALAPARFAQAIASLAGRGHGTLCSVASGGSAVPSITLLLAAATSKHLT
jgi:autotransporter passenger strand-loop-strand repeat protein